MPKRELTYDRPFSNLAAMPTVKVLALLSLLLAPSTYAAISLSQADSWWDFNHASSGTATPSQIVDSNTHAHVAANAYNLSWSQQAADRPPGSTGVGTSLIFNPVLVTHRPGAGTTGSHEHNDTVKGAGFTASNATVTGSVTYLTRLRWDGPVEGTDDNLGNIWFANNGAGALRGNMLGINTSGYLTYFNAGYSSIATDDPRHPGGGVVGGFTAGTSTSMLLEKGVWYNIAMVVDDLSDGNKATGKVTFYLQNMAGGEILSTSSANNLLVTTESGTTLTLGGENLNSTGDASNSRKSFRGAMDHFGLFSGTLSSTEVATLFAVPEPSRAVLLLGGICALLSIRRRS